MGNSQHDIPTIISGCKRGDSESFSKLIDAYSTRLYGYFFRLSGDKTVSDDLLSELFVKLIEKINKFKTGNFDGWIFTVASNLWYDWLRSKQRREKVVAEHREHLEEQYRQSGSKSSDDAAADRLGKVLGKLDEDTRELIVLRYYSDMSFKEIAGMKKEPIGTVLSKVHRGLKRLREEMECPLGQ